MENQNFLELILGSFNGSYIAAFYFFMIIGQLLTMTIHYQVKKVNEIKNKRKLKFSFKHWVQDNWARIVASVLITFVLLRFTPEFAPNYEPNMYFGLLVGLTMDLIIIGFRKYTTLNIFGKKD